MTTLIKGGTVVAADRSYVADVLIEGETIKAIGAGLTGDKVIDAKDCLIIPAEGSVLAAATALADRALAGGVLFGFSSAGAKAVTRPAATMAPSNARNIHALRDIR